MPGRAIDRPRPSHPCREWRVVRLHPEFGERVIVYADAVMDSGQHLDSVYVQDPSANGAGAPLSTKKADTSADSLGKRFEAHTGDTEAGFLHQPSQSVSADFTIPKELKNSSEPMLLLKATTTKTPIVLGHMSSRPDWSGTPTSDSQSADRWYADQTVMTAAGYDWRSHDARLDWCHPEHGDLHIQHGVSNPADKSDDAIYSTVKHGDKPDVDGAITGRKK